MNLLEIGILVQFEYHHLARNPVFAGETLAFSAVFIDDKHTDLLVGKLCLYFLPDILHGVINGPADGSVDDNGVIRPIGVWGWFVFIAGKQTDNRSENQCMEKILFHYLLFCG